MKAKQKKLLMLILACILTVVGTVMAVAATSATAQDFVLTVSTNKDTYSAGEKIYMSIKLDNNTDEAVVNDVDFSYNIPDVVAQNIVDYDKLPTSVNTLKDGQTVLFTTQSEESESSSEKESESSSEKESESSSKNETESSGETTTTAKTEDGNSVTVQGTGNQNPNTGVTDNVMLMIGIMLIAAGVVLALRSGVFKKLASLFMVVVMLLGINGVSGLVAEASLPVTGQRFKVTGTKSITYAGEKHDITVTADVRVDLSKTEEATEDSIDLSSRVSVHDPSIVKEGDTYYIFGSHMAWAKSTDLVNWTAFTNNINRDYATLFAAETEWAKKAGGTYDVSGNLWAPDVIWNEQMGKWCMYMSINGPKWNSTISLLTADSLGGDWTYVGPVIQSGMSNGFGVTFDYTAVTGETEPGAQYTLRKSNPQWEPHAIDPCVTYDEDGNLWMSYGSWSGGIGLFRLDNETGLRDYDTTYELNYGTTDPYFGYKIAGGNQQSGEASYIQKIGDYYYLFMSYGGLVANGGYSMRIFRAEEITGPYVDMSGDDARVAYTAEGNASWVQPGSGAGNINGKVGIKLMTYYQWSYMKYGQVAQGHNSAFTDEDGRSYVVYHTRTNDGTEGHSVRVHQLFINADGWMVAAPHEYRGELLKDCTVTEVAGTYEVLTHKQSIDYGNLECVKAQEITLNADGTVSGAYTGTWTKEDNSPNVVMTLGGVEYNGMFIEQYVEETDYKTWCFTLLGDNEVCVWGTKYLAGENNVKLTKDLGIVKVPTQTIGNINFATKGAFGTTVSYSSSNASIIANDGTVTLPTDTTVVKVTATYTSGEYSESEDYNITVFGKDDSGRVLIGEYYTDSTFDLSGTESIPNPFYNGVTAGINTLAGMTVEFDVTGTGTYLSNILSFMGNNGNSGRLYFTGGSYLGYNATGGFFDANVDNGTAGTAGADTNWSAGEDFIAGDATIRIEFKASGFEVYADDVLAYTNADIGSDVQGSYTVTDYKNVLTWLNETADSLKLGTGSWWNDKFTGTVSNIKVYAYAVVDDTDTSALYHQTFTNNDYSEWASQYNYAGLSVTSDGDDRGNYLHYTYSDNDNNRGAYSNISITPEGDYTVSVDAKLTAGVQADRATSCFALLTTKATGHTANAALTGGYILKLYNEEAFDLGQTTWKINDTETTVDIPKNTWVTITATVNTTASTADVTIVDCSTGTEYYNGTVNVNGTSTTFSGLQLLRGRNSGVFCVDNIKVVD